jgi:hypothetical protein
VGELDQACRRDGLFDATPWRLHDTAIELGF